MSKTDTALRVFEAVFRLGSRLIGMARREPERIDDILDRLESDDELDVLEALIVEARAERAE